MLDFLKQKKIIIIFIGVIILMVGMNLYNSRNDYNTIDSQEILISENNSVESNKVEDTEKAGNMIVIHITGEVKSPGVVNLKEGSRIEDVIKAAGGLTEKADISNVNLAYVVDDGIKIIIPSVDDENNIETDYIIEGSGNGIVISDDSGSDESNSNILVNINKATQTELEELPGIGPSLATRIIEYREQNRGFKNIEDIKNVSGIGENKYANIKDFITCK